MFPAIYELASVDNILETPMSPLSAEVCSI